MHLMEDIDCNKYLDNNFIAYWDRVIHIWVKGKGGKEIYFDSDEEFAGFCIGTICNCGI